MPQICAFRVETSAATRQARRRTQAGEPGLDRPPSRACIQPAPVSRPANQTDQGSRRRSEARTMQRERRRVAWQYRKDRAMQVFLETERLALRRFTMADAGNLVSLDADPDVCASSPAEYPPPARRSRMSSCRHSSGITGGTRAMGSGRLSRRPPGNSWDGSISGRARMPLRARSSLGTGCASQPGARPKRTKRWCLSWHLRLIKVDNTGHVPAPAGITSRRAPNCRLGDGGWQYCVAVI